MSYLIIGDIHGQFDALKELIANSPEHQRRIYVGDIIDRGPKCMESLLFVMADVEDNGAVCLLGNHELMMRDAFEYSKYGTIGVWMHEGGGSTFEAFKALSEHDQLRIIKFLKEMPMYVEGPGFVVSHAPLYQNSIEEVMSFLDRGEMGVHSAFTWNRTIPAPWETHVQFFGHNAEFEGYGKDGRVYAYCVDDTRNGNVASIHWPSMVVTKVNFKGESNGEETKGQAETKTEV